MLHVCTMFVAAIGWLPVLLADAFKAARHICEHYHMQAPDLDIVTAEGIPLLKTFLSMYYKLIEVKCPQRLYVKGDNSFDSLWAKKA